MVNMRKNQQLLLQKRKPEPVVYKEIRINVEIKQSENNIFNFPDLCKEAGIDLTVPKQKYKNYHSGSDTDDNSAEFCSDSESNNNNNNNNNGGKDKKRKNKNNTVEEEEEEEEEEGEEEEELQPEEPQLNEPGDDFFRRILANSEKYAEEEEEEQNNRKKKRQERYDVSDPFIDDSGMVPFQLDKPRPKIEGFYVWRGPLELENTNEKAPGKKRAYKRKKKDNNEEEEEAKGTPKSRKKRNSNTKSKSSEEPAKKGDGNEEPKTKRTKKPRKPRKPKNSDSSTTTATTTTTVTTTVINLENSLSSSSSSSNNNNNNPTTAMDDIDIVPYNIRDSVQEQQQQQTPKGSSSLPSNSNALDDVQLKTLNKNRSKEHKEHKKQNNNMEPLNSELQQILSIFKDEISKENFQVKSKFPQSLKPTLIKLLSKAYELGEFNESLFKVLTNILPYNKFTITRLCYRTMYPKAIHDSRFKKIDLISQFKSSVDEAMPKLLKEYNERLESVNANNSSSSSSPTSPPSSPSNMDDDGANKSKKSNNNNNNKTNNDSKLLVPKKFKWDNHIKSLLYQIIQTEMSIVVMCNQLAEAEERTERQSEQTSRKKLYQHLLAIWPDGWMSSNEIGKIYSAYKKKQQS